MDRDEVEVHKNARKELGQYPAIVTEQDWSIKDSFYGQKITPKDFAFVGTKRARWAHLGRLGSQPEHRIHFIFKCLLAEPVI